ncbi:MAG: LOG family protein [Opitutales bacterium]
MDDKWPPKAYKNADFLNSRAARQIRIMCELTEPGERLSKAGVRNTIVFFGSARIPPAEIADERLREAEAAANAAPDDEAAQTALVKARRLQKAAPFHDAARQLARELASWSVQLKPKQRFYVCTGGGPGLMEAANHGAHDVGMPSLGLGISLPNEPDLNPYVTPELGFEFHYFMIRKYWFAYMAKAMVVCPGGFGTMDEFFELLTLIQTHKTEKYVPIVLLGKAFWTSVMNFDAFVEWGVISPEDLRIFKVCDDVAEARDWIIAELTREHLSPKITQPDPFDGVPLKDPM